MSAFADLDFLLNSVQHSDTQVEQVPLEYVACSLLLRVRGRAGLLGRWIVRLCTVDARCESESKEKVLHSVLLSNRDHRKLSEGLSQTETRFSEMSGVWWGLDTRENRKQL